METHVLVKGGHIEDPIKLFLGEDYNDGEEHSSSDTDLDTVSDIEKEDKSESDESVMDIDDLIRAKENNIHQKVEYDEGDAVTTVITSIHTQMDDVFDENEEDAMINPDKMPWNDSQRNDGEGEGEGETKALSVYEQRKE